MFTGIIEDLGIVKDATAAEGGLRVKIRTRFAQELSVDDSVSVEGVCLTVVESDAESFTARVIEETLRKTALQQLSEGSKVNLERSLMLQHRLDGHLVQGHVDTVGEVLDITREETGWLFRIGFPEKWAGHVVGRGSVAVNGISLTVARVEKAEFTVAIIPYTFEHTTMHALKQGDRVNLEFDIIGKYVLRHLELRDS